MELYLQECKRNFKNSDENSKIQIVLGNESCDLDSAVSAIVYAYFLYKIQTSSDILIPVLNVKRNELALKTEVVYFLEETSICLQDLICIDEIDLSDLHSRSKLSVVLVDHNSLSSELSFLEDIIVQIIDHHGIDNPKRIENLKTKVEQVGSCCTLIAEEIVDSNSSLMDPQVAMLLYGTILLDTVGLKESAKRVTTKDRNIIARLEEYLVGVDRDEVFETLQKVKFDVSNLSPEQMLYKDTKYISNQSSSIALVSIAMLLEDIVTQDSFISALREMSDSRNVVSIILQGLKVDEGVCSVRRQLAVYDPKPQSLEQISNYLLSLENPSLGLVRIPIPDQPLLILYEQENIALTRKFVLPAMQSYINSVHSVDPDLNLTYSVDPLNYSPNMNSTMKSDVNILGDEETDVIDSVIPPLYRAETLDFPDSPNHDRLLGLTATSDQLNCSPEVSHTASRMEDIDLQNGECGDDSRTSTLKRISINPSSLQATALMEEEEDRRSLSSLSDAFSQSEDIILDDDDPSDCDSEDVDLELSDPIPELSAAEELEAERSWKDCVVNGEDRRIDMKVIEPYRKVLSHGGYDQESGGNAIIVFSACHLPDRSRKDYDYVMDNLFLYVIVTLNELVAEDYVLVYLHGATERSSMPSFGWLRRCYYMIDRRLRKNLKRLYLVHPTFWLKTIVVMTRPFISSKFSRKLEFVYSLKELFSILPLDPICVPDKVKQLDFERSMKEYLKEIKSKKTTDSSPLYLTYLNSLYANDA